MQTLPEIDGRPQVILSAKTCSDCGRPLAAIYARVSTTAQRDDGTSLQTQIAACHAHAEKLGLCACTRDDLVFSEDWPGTTLDRPRFDDLRRLARAGSIAAIISYDTDRLSRGDPINLAVVVQELERSGCQVELVSAPLDNSPEGQLLTYVRGWAARFEHAKIKERTLRGRREAARLGRLPTGTTLYGYRYVRRTPDAPARCEIDDEQAEIVRTVFRWYVEDRVTMTGIALRLTDMQVPPPTHGRGDKQRGGGRWHISTVARLLANTSYCGRAEAFKWICVPPKKPHTSQRRYVNTRHEPRPAADRYDASNSVPAIIREELFDAAQVVRERNAAMSQRNRKRDYLLTGHIFCAWCRRRFGATCHPKGWRYYACPGRSSSARSERCRNPLLSAERVEQDVWARVEAVLLNPSIIAAAVRDQQASGQAAETLSADLARVDAILARLVKQEQRLIRLYRLGEYDDETLDAEHALVKSERQRLTVERDRLIQRLAQQESAARTLDTVSAYCARVARQLAKFDHDDKRLALEALGVRVIAEEKAWRVEAALPLDLQEIDSLQGRTLGINQTGARVVIVELPPVRVV